MNLTNGQLHLRHAFLGLVMGFVMTGVGFSDYAEIHKMFTFADLRMLLTFAGAVGLAFVGFLVLARGASIYRKRLHPGVVPGSVLFGAGWALTGSCPSIAMVQFGQGYLPAAFTILGIVAGSWMYREVHRHFFRWDTGACE